LNAGSYRVTASTESLYVFAKAELKLIVYTSSFSGQVRAGRTAFTDVGFVWITLLGQWAGLPPLIG
jgi:hypothetical protein